MPVEFLVFGENLPDYFYRVLKLFCQELFLVVYKESLARSCIFDHGEHVQRQEIIWLGFIHVF